MCFILDDVDPRSGDRFLRDKATSAAKEGAYPILYVQLGLDWFLKQQTGHKSLGNICGRIMNLPRGHVFNSEFIVRSGVQADLHVCVAWFGSNACVFVSLYARVRPYHMRVFF